MEKTNTMTKIYNVIIMDRSGSMEAIRDSAIMGYNEVLSGVKAAKAKYAGVQEQVMTLVLFDSSSIDRVHWNEDPDKAVPLTHETYIPGACTPLFDAMGLTLTHLEKELKGQKDYSVVVTIITDGYENSSQEYDLASIRSLVERLKAEGWTFAYMGTDHDVTSVASKIYINNVINFAKTEEETRMAFEKERFARVFHSKMMAEYDMAHPDADWEEKKAFDKSISEDYYI